MNDSKLPEGWFYKELQFLSSVCLCKLNLNYYKLNLTTPWCVVGEVLYFCVIFQMLNWVEVNGQFSLRLPVRVVDAS
jgi:hypothetical protein